MEAGLELPPPPSCRRDLSWVYRACFCPLDAPSLPVRGCKTPWSRDARVTEQLSEEGARASPLGPAQPTPGLPEGAMCAHSEEPEQMPGR